MARETAAPRKPSKNELKGEIASIERDLSQMFFGGALKILLNGDATLRTRAGGKGIKLYDELERDGRTGAMLDKRKEAVTEREWSVDPASQDAGDIEVAEFITQVLDDLKFDQLTDDALDATLKGYSVLELMWEVRESYADRWRNVLIPKLYIARDQSRFVFDTDRRLRLLTLEKPMDGEELPDRKFVVHVFKGKDGVPYGRGLGSKLFWPVFFKRQGMSFWLTFLDKFGSPTALGKYPSGADVGQQKKLLEVLRAISREAGVAIPDGMEVELLEAARAGEGGYERLLRYCDEEISLIILGETLTSSVGSQGGSRALGDVHKQILTARAKSDADNLSYTLNESLIKWIVEYNFSGRTPPTLWRSFDEPEDLDKLADRDKKLSEIGYSPTEQRIREVYGEGYERKQEPAPAAPLATPPDPTRAEFAEPTSWWRRLLRAVGFAEGDVDKARRSNREDQDALIEVAERLAVDGHVRKRVEDIRALLDETGDLALFAERLDELLATDPSEQFVDALQKAGFGAHLAGRLPRNRA
jgi:phage gp29-like protein